jgi:hypothetical protein
VTDSQANAMVEKLSEISGLLHELVARERPKPQRLLRLSEGAHFLHISVGQLRGLIQRGEIDVVRQSNGSRIPWLVDLEDLNRWIEKAKVNIG